LIRGHGGSSSDDIAVGLPGPGRRRLLLSAALLGASVASAARAQQGGGAALAYDAQTRGPVPIPPSERALQAVVAELWFKVSNEGLVLEGPAFDRAGNLLFCDVSDRRVLRLTPDRQLTVVTDTGTFAPGGLAIHRNGRIFIAALDIGGALGCVLAVEPNGSGLRTVIPSDAGFMPNDLVFDAQGGCYFTDFRGASTDPIGGVFYLAPDHGSITPVLPRLAMANGVALSPDGRVLWATEFSRNLLHRVELANATTAAPFGTAVAYHFTGPAPDSMRADADGNLYVALYGQGRVLALNRNGIPIGQVLLPGREMGHNLRSTSLAMRPGTDEVCIVTSDGDGGQGATIFRARAFAPALPLYAHQ
jgi:lactonase